MYIYIYIYIDLGVVFLPMIMVMEQIYILANSMVFLSIYSLFFFENKFNSFLDGILYLQLAYNIHWVLKSKAVSILRLLNFLN